MQALHCFAVQQVIGLAPPSRSRHRSLLSTTVPLMHATHLGCCCCCCLQVERLIHRTRFQLERLQQEEAAYDEQEQLTGVDAAPLLRPEERAAAEAALRAPEADAEEDEEEEQEEETSSSSSSSSLYSSDSSSDEEEEDEAERAGARRRRAAKAASAAEQQRRQRLRRRDEDVGRRAAVEQQRAQRVQDNAERQAALEELRRQQQQAAVDADAAKLARLLPQGPPGAVQPAAAAEGEAAAAAAEATGSAVAAASTSPTGSGSLGWKRCAQQLLRQAGDLPKRSAAPAGKTSGQGAPAPAGSLPAKEIERLVEGAVLPSCQLIAAVCRAICNATEVRLLTLPACLPACMHACTEMLCMSWLALPP
jgi:hypothetical protein